METFILTKYRIFGNIVAAISLFFIGINESYADSISIKNGHQKEEYAGKILEVSNNIVKFDIECKGNVKILNWFSQVTELRFNKRCDNPTPIAAGGFEEDCKSKFMIIDSDNEIEEYDSDIRYKDGIFTFGNIGIYDFNIKQYFSKNNPSKRYYMKSNFNLTVGSNPNVGKKCSK